MKTILVKKCNICAKEFARPEYCSYKNWEKRKSCSRLCRDATVSTSLKGRKPKNLSIIAGWNKGMNNYWNVGEKHHNWKGDKAGIVSLHTWVKTRLGFPNRCETCELESDSHHEIHWSNVSGEYKRDLSDWQRLCASCHKKYDNKMRGKVYWRNQYSHGITEID